MTWKPHNSSEVQDKPWNLGISVSSTLRSLGRKLLLLVSEKKVIYVMTKVLLYAKEIISSNKMFKINPLESEW
jgi:hypothetical protein